MISVVIPAHNEAGRILPTLIAYDQHFGERIELVVVPNGCTDTTAEIVTDFSKRSRANVTCISIAEAVGKGGALLQGLRRAKGDIIGFIDADGATSPGEFERLSKMLQGHDMVFGSRWMQGATVYNRTSPLRKVASVVFVWLVKLLFRLPYHDTQCGIKIFTRRALDAILPECNTQDATLDVELIVRARNKGFRIAEIPTVWTDYEGSAFSSSPKKFFSASLRMATSLLKLRRRITITSTL